MCWGGFTAISGKAQPPEQVGCTKNHYWETFAAIPLPDGALDVRVDRLIKRPDVAAACSAQLMASRSRDPGRTKRWRRDVWPIQQPGSGAWLLHCMSGPTDGEIAEPAF
jgi:serine/threonine-protein kinase